MRTVPAAMILLGAALCSAQNSSTVSLSNGVQLSIAANLGHPTGEQTIKIQLVPASGNSIYRIFRDQNDLAVFAYELAVERSADGTEFLLTAKPVETEFAARFPGADGGKPVPTFSSEQKLPALRSGAKSEIGLFELQGMGLRVVDSVQVRIAQAASATLESPSQSRLRFSRLAVSINGTPVPGTGARASVSGRYLMFYIPGRGGYFFSTETPPQGHPFVKAGTIDGNKLQFTLDNEIYDCTADGPILRDVGTGEVWIYRDPAYKPEGNWTKTLPAARSTQVDPGFFTAASDSLNWWLP